MLGASPRQVLVISAAADPGLPGAIINDQPSLAWRVKLQTLQSNNPSVCCWCCSTACS